MTFQNFLLKSSVESIPKHYHAEFWRENLITNVRRIRSLLVFAVVGLCFLLYIVHRRNIFNLPDDARFAILTMQILVLVVISTFALLFFARPINPDADNNFYFSVLTRLFAVIVIVTVQAFVYTLLKTNGHPVFFFQIIVSWSAALLITPRTAILLGFVMFGTFAAITIQFTPPQENTRFVLESIVSSAAITFISVLSSTILFRNAVKSFCQRKAVEEERNRVAELNEELRAANLEAEVMNQELKSRQEVLEEQAMEIEIINTELHEKNEILVELNDEKNEFLGIAAHDLKNPLNSIRGIAQMVRKRKEIELSDDEVDDMAHQIETSSNFMFEIITNLLDVNKIENGKLVIQPSSVDLVLSLGAVTDRYQAPAAKKNITLHVELPAEDTQIYADPTLTIQVLDNIVSNAVKYSPQGKNVWVTVSCDAVQHRVRVAVKDEGPGFSEEDKKKLFGKFARLTAKPTGGEHSTGLGLSIVKRLAEAMDASIWCESELGKGATFIIEFPDASMMKTMEA